MLEPKTKRHRSFCDRVVAGEPLGEAWSASARDVGKRPGSRAADNVSGSRNAAKFADFIAAKRAEIAAARAAGVEPITRASVHDLLESVTGALMAGSRAASAAGATNLAQQMNRLIVLHSGRQGRASARAPKDEKEQPTFDPSAPLQRLKWCTCSNV